jgi:hypothetical protein
MQQAHTDMGLQLAQGLAEGGGGDLHLGRGTGKASMAGNQPKGTQGGSVIDAH